MNGRDNSGNQSNEEGLSKQAELIVTIAACFFLLLLIIICVCLIYKHLGTYPESSGGKEQQVCGTELPRSKSTMVMMTPEQIEKLAYLKKELDSRAKLSQGQNTQ